MVAAAAEATSAHIASTNVKYTPLDTEKAADAGKGAI